MVKQPGPDPDRGVYGISVAAELVGMGVQNLRLYEARGLLQPARTDGGTRRYICWSTYVRAGVSRLIRSRRGR